MTKTLALFLIFLLLISTGLATALSQDGSSISSDRTLKDKVESLLEEVGKLLSEARQEIEQAGDAGLDVKIYREILEAAELKYQEGLELYKRGEHDKAFSTLVYAKTRIQIIIKALQGIVGGKISVKPSIQEVQSKLESLKKKYDELESIVVQFIEEEPLEKLLSQARDLISKAEDILDKNPQTAYSLLVKAETVLRQVEEAVGVSQTTVATKETETSHTSIQPITPSTKMENTVSTTLYIQQSSSTESETVREGEVNIELERKDGEYRVVVEHVEYLIQYENGTTLISREKIITIGNKTIVSISKELVYGMNESRNIGQVSVEQERNIVGAWFKIFKDAPPEVYRLDEAIEAQIMEAEKNRVKVRLKAPDNTSGRLFIVELSPEVVDLENIMGFNLTVNNEKAILASSFLDLASGIYDQPAYVFIISARGIQVLLYIPHFSEYIVEINAVIQKVIEVFKENLQRIFTIQVATYTTVTATIILIASTAIIINQKRRLQKIG
ncbi:MAG: hypothetical protein QW724_03985 [Nitrososphaerota archaeon]